MVLPSPSPENRDPIGPKVPSLQEFLAFQENPDPIARMMTGEAPRSRPKQEEEYFISALVAYGSTKNDAWNILRLADRWNTEVLGARDRALKGLFDCTEERHHGVKYNLPGDGFGGGNRGGKKGIERPRDEAVRKQLISNCQSLLDSAPIEEAIVGECSAVPSLEAFKAFFSLSESERAEALKQAGASLVTEGKGEFAISYLQGEYLTSSASFIQSFCNVVNGSADNSTSNAPGVVKLAEDTLAILRNCGLTAATYYINSYLDCLKDPPQFILDLQAYQNSLFSLFRSETLDAMGMLSFAKIYLRDSRGQDYFADVLQPLSTLIEESDNSILPVLQALPLDFDHLEQTFKFRVDKVQRLWKSPAAPVQEKKRKELLLRTLEGVAPEIQETLLEKMAIDPDSTWSVLGLPLTDKLDSSAISQVFLEFQHLQVDIPAEHSHLGELIMSLSKEKRNQAACSYLLKEGSQRLKEILSVHGSIPEDVKLVLASLFDGELNRERVLRMYLTSEDEASRELIVKLLRAKSSSKDIVYQVSKRLTKKAHQPDEEQTYREKRELLYSRQYAVALKLVPEEERKLIQRLALAEPHAGEVVLNDILACLTPSSTGDERTSSLKPFFLMLKDSSLFRFYRETLREGLQPQDRNHIREKLASLCIEPPRNPYKELYTSLMQDRESEELPIRFFPIYISESSVDQRSLVIDPSKEVIIWHGAPFSSASQSTLKSTATEKGLNLRFRSAREPLSDIQLESGTTIIAVVGAMSHSAYYAGMTVAKKRSCLLHQLPPTAGASSVVSLLQRAELSSAA